MEYEGKRQRTYFIIRTPNGDKFFDIYLKLMMTKKEFDSLKRSGYFDNFELNFEYYVEH